MKVIIKVSTTKKSLLEKAGVLYFDEVLFKSPGYEDMDFILRIKKMGILGACIDCPVNNVRSLNLKSFLSNCNARHDGYHKLIVKHSDLQKTVPVFFYQTTKYDVIGFIILFFSRNSMSFLLSRFRSLCVSNTNNNIFYRLSKALEKELS